ncbi:stage V sporulation protein AF [Anaerobranca californiensis DSM 14826]|uniref:Stage V sporulation protein AF n=1 Tax=Anaerobranca californiensis DSM 14826 TaxID=1120989 RepID=A0A1M6L2D5_9FIRM|nr:spore germination protein [Anaerobranca californiensis]SHJ65347.1 stage V sporulation protein AF [Anaerobranca californiensis DSM 14826]
MKEHLLEKKLEKDLEKNVEILEKKLGVGISFDVINREFIIGGKRVALFFVDGFAKDDVMLMIMQTLYNVKREEIVLNPVKKLIETKIPYIEVDEKDTIGDCIDSILSGALILLVEGENVAIEIDAREYPARGPEEPDVERVTRGSRDGFVETMIFNTALIRRRIRDPQLRIEHLSVGTRSKTDIALCYIEDIANKDLVNLIRDSIEKIKVDGLPMAEKSLEEFIVKAGYSPFPQVRYTERPDVAAMHLLEGHVVIICDTSPSVIIAPATIFHHLQHAEEYRQIPVVGTYMRWIRTVAVLFSMFITPLWLALSYQREILPKSLSFIGPEKVGNIPLWVQLLIAEIGIDMIRMATVHTPSPLATALGIIAAFMIGDIAIQVGLLTPEVVLYLAIAALGTFATPSLELGHTLRLFRLFLLSLAAIFQVPGVIGGTLIFLIVAASTKSFGVPYLWPLIPLNINALWTIIVRRPVPIAKSRPSAIKPKDEDRT